MKVIVIITTTIVSLVLTNGSVKRLTDTGVEYPVDYNTTTTGGDYPTNDKTTMIHLSNTVNEITSKLIKIVKNKETSFEDDLKRLVYPLKDIISFIWSAPSDKLLKENLYFLFDKLLDIVHRIHKRLDGVWHGASHLIESKLSQISLLMLQIDDELKTFVEPNEDKFTTIKEAIVELTTSIVGLTSITCSIAQLITTRDRRISLIVETIASMVLIHQYTVAAVACLLYRQIDVIYSLDQLHATGIATLIGTILDFVLNLKPVLLNKHKETTATQLFHGDLHMKLSMELLVSMNGLLNTKMIDLIYTTTSSLLTIIQENAPGAFHVLPDLIDPLAVISFRCGQTDFDKLEMVVTYAFDGLFDVLSHISYKLDKHIQSSASTGSFAEPSEPIDITVECARTEVKRFVHDCQEISKCDTKELTTHLIASTKDLLKASLEPMITVINKSDDDYSITLASSLQFIALYVIGLTLTSLISLTNSLRDSTVIISDMYSDLGATLSMFFIKIQLIFDFLKTKSAIRLLKRLYDCFDDLVYKLGQLKD